MPPEFPSLPESLEAFGAPTAIVLGSGLGSLVDSLHIEDRIPYHAIAGLPVSRIYGHAGEFLLARVHGRPLLLASGRVHLYEGWSPHEVTAGIRLLHRIGVRRIVLTNAAGTLNPGFPPGQWMMLSDHLNLTATSPLMGESGFIDLSDAYSPRLRELFRHAATELGIPLHEGVYAGVRGPQYETPAEIRMLRAMGADAVGMSTVLETIQARALGLDVLGFSCLTNWAAGLSSTELSHEEVAAAGASAAASFLAVLHRVMPTLLG
jgi:purine-nucleoside phosphorylase